MNQDAFVAWALDPARSLDERFTIEEITEVGVSHWNSQRRIFERFSLDDRMAVKRERQLNPAYEPLFDEGSLRKSAEGLEKLETWWHQADRPWRSLEAFRFFPALREITLGPCEVTDLAPLAELPGLVKLSIGSPGYPFGNPACRDFTPLARCRALRTLELGFNARWPDLAGLDSLPLENLTLGGNLLALPRGMVFPAVLKAVLYCLPLAMRSVADLPQLPACEFLELAGVESLAGIEHWPRVRNLKLRGPFESFEPLTALRELTCLTVTSDHAFKMGQPREVAPLARLPKLHFFQIGPEVGVQSDIPRDYAPLAEAPALRELVVKHCPPVQMEVAAIQAGLPPCDDLFLRAESLPLPPLYIVVSKNTPFPLHPEEQRGPDETGLIDVGLRDCEGRWVGRYLQHQIDEKLGQSDWGEAGATGLSRRFWVEIHSYAVVEKLPIILETARAAMAALRAEYFGTVQIQLRIPPPPLSAAHQQLNEQFRDEQDRWEYEEHRREQEEYLERLHRLELKKEEGTEINPEDFSPNERSAYPEKVPAHPEEDDDDEPTFEHDEGDEGDEGGIAVEKEPPPPPALDLFDDEHPLAGAYRLMADFTLDTLWIRSHHRGIALHLLNREADEERPDEA